MKTFYFFPELELNKYSCISDYLTFRRTEISLAVWVATGRQRGTLVLSKNLLGLIG
jgi:hypothetical protein